MLEARELRIGNWIKTNQGIQQVTQVEENRVISRVPPYIFSMVNFDYYEVDPIPLTEEWFIKFGFEKESMRYAPTKFLYQKYPISFYTGDMYIKLNGNYEFIIIYVHQLQNLYFALTGKELTL